MSESVAPTVAQLLPLLIFEAGPQVLLPRPHPSGHTAGDVSLGARAGRKGEDSGQPEQHAAKRARTFASSAQAGSSSAAAASSAGAEQAAAGSHRQQQQQQAGGPSLQGCTAGKAAGTVAGGITPQLLLQCLGWCQKWVVGAVSKYEAARVHAFPMDFTGLRKG